MKHIHFIGICGVAMSALAIAFHKQGYRVTGSDKGFYPPVSTHLKEAGVSYYPGWHVDKMCANGNPDLVVVGNVAGSENPEWQYVQENNLPYKSYPEVIAEFFVQPTSLVCAGTYGKTTSTALLAWIFTHAGKDPNYMFGGLSNNNLPAAALANTPLSILEGDEYKSARWDAGAKFFHYAPTHLLLTSVVWDHADVYPTEALYDEAFTKLVSLVPQTGLLVVSAKVTHEKPDVLNGATAPIITYGKTPDNTYHYTNIQASQTGITFDIVHKEDVYTVHTSELGDYMPDNMTGCFALAHELCIPPHTIIEAIQAFKGMKRRLEKRLDGQVCIFDDIAHSPKKAEAVLRSMRTLYRGKVIAVFEPNTGNRYTAAMPGYAHAFADADVVYIPRLSHVKQEKGSSEIIVTAQELAAEIQKTHPHVVCIEDDGALVQELQASTVQGDVIIFLGSHGFRGMIETLIERLEQKNS